MAVSAAGVIVPGARDAQQMAIMQNGVASDEPGGITGGACPAAACPPHRERMPGGAGSALSDDAPGD